MPTIKEEMAAIDRRKFDWYSKLSEEEQKSLSMWVLMRYCSSTGSKVEEINEHYLIMTNELVNVYFNDLRHHPELQMRLMQCVGIGTNQFHPWIKPGKRKKDGNKVNKKLFDLFETRYPHLNDDEIDFLISNLSKDEIKANLTDSGMSDKQIKELMK